MRGMAQKQETAVEFEQRWNEKFGEWAIKNQKHLADLSDKYNVNINYGKFIDPKIDNSVKWIGNNLNDLSQYEYEYIMFIRENGKTEENHKYALTKIGMFTQKTLQKIKEKLYWVNDKLNTHWRNEKRNRDSFEFANNSANPKNHPELPAELHNIIGLGMNMLTEKTDEMKKRAEQQKTDSATSPSFKP